MRGPHRRSHRFRAESRRAEDLPHSLMPRIGVRQYRVLRLRARGKTLIGRHSEFGSSWSASPRPAAVVVPTGRDLPLAPTRNGANDRLDSYQKQNGSPAGSGTSPTRARAQERDQKAGRRRRAARRVGGLGRDARMQVVYPNNKDENSGLTRFLDFRRAPDAWTERHCRPLCRDLIDRM
jgi:hypothetical protein